MPIIVAIMNKIKEVLTELEGRINELKRSLYKGQISQDSVGGGILLGLLEAHSLLFKAVRDDADNSSYRKDE